MLITPFLLEKISNKHVNNYKHFITKITKKVNF